jgi:hypothetical protein
MNGSSRGLSFQLRVAAIWGAQLKRASHMLLGVVIGQILPTCKESEP